MRSRYINLKWSGKQSTLMTKTIAITGASGFTGGAIARHFHEMGWRVLAFGRRNNPDLPSTINYQQWDIANGTITIKETVDVVVHSAALVDDRGKRKNFMRVNVIGTQNVLDSFRDAGQVIYISSSSVYDPFTKKIHIDENFPYSSHYYNAYGETKMLAEKTILENTRSNKVILRPRAIYGEGDTTLLPRLLNLHRGKFMIGIGTGKNEISITYIRNFCYAIEKVTGQTFDSEIFNITDTETITQRQLLARIANLIDSDFHPLFIPRNIINPLAKVSDLLSRAGIQTQLSSYAIQNLAETFTLDIRKAQQLLDYQPPYSQSEAFTLIKANFAPGN